MSSKRAGRRDRGHAYDEPQSIWTTVPVALLHLVITQTGVLHQSPRTPSAMPGLIALSTSDSRLDEKRLHFATRQPHLRARCNSAVRRRRWRRSWRTRLRARPTTPIPGSLRSSGPTRDASAGHWDDEGWARRSGLVMGFDTHMIAGSRACPPSTRLTHPTITNQTSPHYAGALGVPGRRAEVRRRACRSPAWPSRSRPSKGQGGGSTTSQRRMLAR